MNLDNFRLVASVGDGKQTACLLSLRNLLDGRGLTDDHPSGVLRKIGVRVNDGPWWESDEERTRVLMQLALDERLCASKCDASPEAERKRAQIAGTWARRFAAPLALDSAASALRHRWPERAAELAAHAATLRADPTRENALKASKSAAVAYAARAAVDAAADDDAAAYAAYAAADAAKVADRKQVRDELIALFGRLLDVRGDQ